MVIYYPYVFIIIRADQEPPSYAVGEMVTSATMTTVTLLV